ncbi:MAG: NAD(P)H-dependent oxidoreductase [Acidaminococcaceae bacterium]
MNTVNKQIMDAFNYRYACKAFDPERKIAESDFETIIEAARLSPSSFGFEPWKFLVIQNKDLLNKLLPISWGAQGQFPTASHVVVILARKMIDTKAGSDYIYHVMRDIQKLPDDVQIMKNGRFNAFQENDFDLTDERKLFDWACKQTYIALANMMTTAALLGIDSCPMEGFERSRFEEILSETENLDREHFGVSVMVAFGYRAKNSNIYQKTRGESEDVIKWVK